MPLFTIVITLFAALLNAAEFDKGFRLPLESVSKNFALMKLTPTNELLKNYIIKTNFRITPNEADQISAQILDVSECFEIDPWILTGLIQKESSFNRNAVSPTGAAGLTQFTSMGFKEVNDQLGMRGRIGAPEVVSQYFEQKIKNCIDPFWMNLWERVAVNEDHPDFYNLLKDEIKKDTYSSIVYGAVLLKTYLAFITTKNTFEAIPFKTSEIYFQALQLYNGEEGDAKVTYSRNIFQNLKSLYPNEVNFPF